MAQSEKIPTYGICNLVGDNDAQQDIIVYDLASFVDSHKDLVFPHRHSFYQVLYISSGSRKMPAVGTNNKLKAEELAIYARFNTGFCLS